MLLDPGSLPSGKGINMVSIATRELIGRVYYKVLSWTDILR